MVACRVLDLVLVTFILALVGLSGGCRLAKQLECLHKEVTLQCNLKVTPAGEDKPLTCDEVLPENVLEKEPKLTVPKTEDFELPLKVLILLYDVDAPPEPKDEADGWMHWIARGTLENDGGVTVDGALSNFGYAGPSPPAGMEHRYQFMLFSYSKSVDKVVVNDPNSRIDQFCRFMKKNGLDQPIAATQIRYEKK